MSTSQQLSAASTDLVQTSQKYFSIAGELDGITVTMSQITTDILETWSGLASSAFALGQRQAARDAYRVIAALMDAAVAMLALAETINQNEGAVHTYELVSIKSIDQKEIQAATSGLDAAVAAIQQSAYTLNTNISKVATQLGTVCSTGNEVLPPGQVDGVTEYHAITKDANGNVIKDEIINGPPGGNNNNNNAPPGGKNPCSPSVLLELLAQIPGMIKSLTLESFGRFVKDALPSSIITALISGGANSYAAFLSEGGYDHTVQNVFVGATIGGIFGPINNKASKYITSCFPKGKGIFDLTKKENYTLTIFGSILGGVVEGGLLGHFVINPILFPQPNLPPVSSQGVKEAEIREIQRELNNPTLPAAEKATLQQQLNDDINAYYQKYGTLPPTGKPTPTPTPTPTPRPFPAGAK